MKQQCLRGSNGPVRNASRVKGFELCYEADKVYELIYVYYGPNSLLDIPQLHFNLARPGW